MSIVTDRPEMPAPSLWRFPAFDAWNLPDGTVGHHLELDSERMLHVALHFPMNLAAEPRDREGITELCARLLTDGTGRAEGFAGALDRIAANLWTDVAFEGITVGLDVPVHHAGEGLRLLGLALTAPAFADEDVQRQRRDMIAGLRMLESDGPAVAERTLWRSLYASADRRSRAVNGDEQTLASLDRESVCDWYERVIRLERAHVVSVGGVATASVVDGVQQIVEARHPSSPALELPESAEHAHQASRTVFVNRPAAGQTAIEIGCLLADLDGPDWASMRVASRVLGEGLRSRLNLVLREQKGFTYGVHAAASRNPSGGDFRVTGTFSASATGEALRDALDILVEFRESGPTADEHRTAVDAIISRTPIGHQTGRDILRTVLAGVQLGLPVDWITGWLTDVQATSASSVAEVIHRVLPSRTTVIIAGDADVCLPLLAEAGIVVDQEIA